MIDFEGLINYFHVANIYDTLKGLKGEFNLHWTRYKWELFTKAN